jgi:hypothetical protein
MFAQPRVPRRVSVPANEIPGMKKHYIFLPLSLFLAASVCAQQRAEFGFSVKAGNFTLPSERIENTWYTKSYTPGRTAAFGIYGSKRFGGHFGLAAEFLYQMSFYQAGSLYQYDGGDVDVPWTFDTRYRFEVQNLMMPLKLQFYPAKQGKLMLSAGVAPTFILESRVNTTYGDNTYSSAAATKDRVVRRDGESGGIHWFFIAGAQYYLRPHTSIGLDFTGTLKNNATEFYSDVYFCDVGADVGVSPTFPYWMRSFTFSLRHSLLR